MGICAYLPGCMRTSSVNPPCVPLPPPAANHPLSAATTTLVGGNHRSSGNHVSLMDANLTLAWVASKEADGEWLQARVTARAEDGTVTLETLETQEIHTSSADQLLLVNELPEEGMEDMTRLNYLHEPALLNNLRHRFSRDHVYTYTGKICIAVNPFNWKVSDPLYTEDVLVRYRGQEFGERPPHVYAIAEDAYQQILAERSNQSILVSGESGAGKTESVKIMMQYLAVVSKSGDQNKVAAQVRR